jgi:hypothetical protein
MSKSSFGSADAHGLMRRLGEVAGGLLIDAA